VFLEDPLRVLRAARFLARLPGFRVAPSAIPEMKRAGRRLRVVSEERRLAEMDELLAAPAAGRMKGLRFLARLGVLQVLVRSRAPRVRRGISLVSRVKGSDPRVARALLLLPQGAKRAEGLLGSWKTSREEQRLASRLFSLPLRRPGRGAVLRREVAELLRRSSPFEEESLVFLLAAGDARTRDLAREAGRVVRRPDALRRILRPERPLSLDEIRTALKLDQGPELGRALGELDLALAAGEVRGARAARTWLAERARPGKDASRLVI
jgi:tRNA nucleotidyltransferase/poly(A) polymerase